MKILRLLLNGLVVAVVLAAILAGLAFVPAVQTWCAQQALGEHPDLHGSLGSFSAGFGQIEVADLHLKTDGAELTLPSLTAELPLLPAVWDHQMRVRRLVAKGWTLDLSRLPGAKAGEAAAGSVSAQTVAAALQGTLGRWTLPCDLSLDGAELEGDLLVATPGAKAPARVHVILRGGGLAAGREGSFAIAASSVMLDSQMVVTELAAQGRLAVAMNTPRTFRRLEVKADLSAKGGPFPAGLALAVHALAASDANGQTYALELSRGPQRLASLVAGLSTDGSRLTGTWKLDLHDSDVAPFLPDRPLPRFQATGAGRFDSDAAFGRVHAQGDLNAVLSRLETLAPSLENAGTVNLAAGFDATRSSHSLRVDRLNVVLTGAGPAAVLRLLRPLTCDERTGEFKPVGADGDWLEVSLRRFPLALIAGLPGGFAFSGGTAAGEFVVRAGQGEFVLHPRGPLTAAGVSLQRAGRTVARNLDLSASLLAREGPEGWQIQAAPLRLASGGRPLAELAAKLIRPAGADQTLAITGTWQADLQSLSAQAVFPDLGRLAGRSASGDFSATLGAAPAGDGTLAIVGHDPRDSLTASVHVEVGQEGTISFVAPVKVTLGTSASELSVEGAWSQDETGSRLSLQLNGENVVWEHLRALATPLGAAAANGAARDRVPFWGGWVGSLRVAFDHLKAGDKSYADVSGTFEVDHASIHLEGGHVGLDAPRAARVEGALTFSPAATLPYQLQATAAIDPFKAAPFFPSSEPDGFPEIDGRVAIAASLAGQGSNLPDLVRRTEETFQLTSTDAIVRVLKTDVHEAIPHAESSRISEGLGTMGSALGSFFGRNRDGSSAAKNPLSPTAEAVIDFTHDAAELGFDRATVTAVREADGAIRLTKIDLTAERERITGTGRITAVPGLAFRAQPLSLDLEFWARGRIAQLLTTAGLLSAQKDDRGFARLNRPIHLGGTLEHIDISQWHRLLVKAAAQNPAGPKKKSP